MRAGSPRRAANKTKTVPVTHVLNFCFCQCLPEAADLQAYVRLQ